MNIETILAEFDTEFGTEVHALDATSTESVKSFLHEKMSALLDELKGDFILSDAINQPTLDFIKAIIESKK